MKLLAVAATGVWVIDSGQGLVSARDQHSVDLVLIIIDDVTDFRKRDRSIDTHGEERAMRDIEQTFNLMTLEPFFGVFAALSLKRRARERSKSSLNSSKSATVTN
jgi:hypothetical protein